MLLEESRPIDRYSYELGVMDCFCEMVAAGVKTMAMSHPWDVREERDAFSEAVKGLCDQYRIQFYPEDDLLLTDLFPEEDCKGKFLFLFYRAGETFECYLSLKRRRRILLEEGRYMGPERRRLAEAFGRLLSYPEDGIERQIEKTLIHKEDSICKQKHRH